MPQTAITLHFEGSEVIALPRAHSPTRFCGPARRGPWATASTPSKTPALPSTTWLGAAASASSAATARSSAPLPGISRTRCTAAGCTKPATSTGTTTALGSGDSLGPRPPQLGPDRLADPQRAPTSSPRTFRRREGATRTAWPTPRNNSCPIIPAFDRALCEGRMKLIAADLAKTTTGTTAADEALSNFYLEQGPRLTRRVPPPGQSSPHRKRTTSSTESGGNLAPSTETAPRHGG